MRRSGHLFAWQGHKRALLTHVTHDEDQELLALPFRALLQFLGWKLDSGDWFVRQYFDTGFSQAPNIRTILIDFSSVSTQVLAWVLTSECSHRY